MSISFTFNNDTFYINKNKCNYFIGDNFIKTDSIIQIIDSYFTATSPKVAILEDGKSLNKKDYLYIKLSIDTVQTKEVEFNKKSFIRKILDDILGSVVEEESFSDNYIKLINEMINQQQNKYLDNLSSFTDGLDSVVLNLKPSELSKKILLEYLMNINFIVSNDDRSLSYYEKLILTLNIIFTYITMFSAKNVIILLDNIVYKMNSTQKSHYYKLLHKLNDTGFCTIISFQEELFNIYDNYCKYNSTIVVTNRILQLNKDLYTIQDLTDAYPSHISQNDLEVITCNFIEHYLFVFSKPNFLDEHLDSTSVDDKNMYIALKDILSL